MPRHEERSYIDRGLPVVGIGAVEGTALDKGLHRERGIGRWHERELGQKRWESEGEDFLGRNMFSTHP